MTQQQLLDQYVSLPDEAQHQVADFVAFLRQKYGAVQLPQKSPTTELENEAFVGLWKNRQDLSDSTNWVRNTRKAEWGETA